MDDKAGSKVGHIVWQTETKEEEAQGETKEEETQGRRYNQV